MAKPAGVIDSCRVLVCVGSGGVGKTTCAAALGLTAALKGKKAMVLTIDPARRLAQSLGLADIEGGAVTLPPSLFEAAGLHLKGSLSAGMLDQKSAWDEFITSHAPTPEVARTILDNSFYKHLSSSFAGSVEFMAIEELCRIDESGEYDIVILDTPPTRHALDFLDAPVRVEAFLDSRIMNWVILPYARAGRGAWKTASRTASFLLSRLEAAAGGKTLGDVSAFFVAMEALFDGVGERTRKVRSLMRGEATACVLVAGPEEQVLGESEYLSGRMKALDMHLGAVIMNRVHPLCAADEAVVDAGAAVESVLGGMEFSKELKEWMKETYGSRLIAARAEAVRREVFFSGLDESVGVVAVPEIGTQVNDISTLAEVASFLTG